MKIFETVFDYLKEAKINDFVAFGGTGILNGLSHINYKSNVYKVVNVSGNNFYFKAYRGKGRLTIGEYYYSQQVAVLDKSEYSNLPVLK